MNRKQKARKIRRAQAHHGSVTKSPGVATLSPRAQAEVDAEREVIASGKRFAELHGETGTAPTITTTSKPRRNLLRRRINMAEAAEDAMTKDGYVKVDALRTTEIEIEAVLEPAVTKARKQKKTVVLLREMAASGYKPKEGIEPKPSTTTAADWEPVA
jgi:hypothetical protein